MERRKYPRIKANLFAVIKDPIQLEKLGRSVVVDVSKGGLGVESEAILEHNRVYVFEVEVPMRFKGRVVRRESKGQIKRYGIVYEGLSFLDKLFIQRYLKTQSRTIKVN